MDDSICQGLAENAVYDCPTMGFQVIIISD